MKELTLNVAQAATSQKVTGAPAPQPVEKETRILDVNEAKLAGARLDHGIESGGDCSAIGAFDAKLHAYGHQGTVRFSAGGCLLAGGKATPQAFLDFRLKNGWVVKDYISLYNRQEGGEWTLLTPPAKGSNNPYMKAHIWANPSRVLLVLQVTQGTQGHEPYAEDVARLPELSLFSNARNKILYRT